MEAFLDVVIVNFNAGLWLKECLTALVASNTEHFRFGRVVIVDNASTDSSMRDLPAGLPLTIIHNSENRGFGAACNQGAAAGTNAPFILFLNPDTRVLPDTLDRIITQAQSMPPPESGICGVKMLDASGQTIRSCARFPTPSVMWSQMLGLPVLWPSCAPQFFMVDWDHGESRHVDEVIGAFFLVRRKLFQLLRGFDESFFVYLEDLDFSLRARKAGWKTYFFADAALFHQGGGTTEKTRGYRHFLAAQNRIVYSHKHFSSGASWGLVLGTLLVEPLTRLGLAIIRPAAFSWREWWLATRLVWKTIPRVALFERKTWEPR